MDSLDLLAREEEFKRLNKQLEKKSHSLMKEIENVMQKQDFFQDFPKKLNLNLNTSNYKKHCCGHGSVTPDLNTPNKSKEKNKVCLNTASGREHFSLNEKLCVIDQAQVKNILYSKNDSQNKPETMHDLNTDCAKEHCCANICTDCRNPSRINFCECYTVPRRSDGDIEFLYAFVSLNVQENILPKSFLKDRVSVESVCKFLVSKIKLLQEHTEKLQVSLDKKVSQCEGHLTKIAELESERMSLLNKSNNFKSEALDLKAKYASIQNKFHEKDRLYKELRSETDKMACELKRLRSQNATIEARYASQSDVIDSLKQSLEAAKGNEKEFRDSSRSLSVSHQNAIHKLEDRVKNLRAHIDTQVELIDNLRRQNALLATEGALKALEREYYNFLTQD